MNKKAWIQPGALHRFIQQVRIHLRVARGWIEDLFLDQRVYCRQAGRRTVCLLVHGGRPDSGVDLLGTPYSGDALARKVRHVLADQALRAFALGDSAPTSLHSD